MPFCVYSHTSPNGKMYVGITSMEPARRWLGGSGYKGNKKFYTDIQKYGWDSFKHEILAENLTQDEAVSLEKQLIEKYETVSDGYNNSRGGRYGKSGLLSHECNMMMNALKKHRGLSVAHDDMYQVFKKANDPGDHDIYRRFNLYMPEVIKKIAEYGYTIKDIQDEMCLAFYIHEFQYLIECENAFLSGQDLPEYKSLPDKMHEVMSRIEQSANEQFYKNHCR